MHSKDGTPRLHDNEYARGINALLSKSTGSAVSGNMTALDLAMTPFDLQSLPTQSASTYGKTYGLLSRRTSLKSAGFPSLTEVVPYMFYGCTSLGSGGGHVDVGSAESVGERAFSGCTSLTSLSLPKATQIGREALCSTPNTQFDIGGSSGRLDLSQPVFDTWNSPYGGYPRSVNRLRLLSGECVISGERVFQDTYIAGLTVGNNTTLKVTGKEAFRGGCIGSIRYQGNEEQAPATPDDLPGFDLGYTSGDAYDSSADGFFADCKFAIDKCVKICGVNYLPVGHGRSGEIGLFEASAQDANNLGVYVNTKPDPDGEISSYLYTFDLDFSFNFKNRNVNPLVFNGYGIPLASTDETNKERLSGFTGTMQIYLPEGIVSRDSDNQLVWTHSGDKALVDAYSYWYMPPKVGFKLYVYAKIDGENVRVASYSPS